MKRIILILLCLILSLTLLASCVQEDVANIDESSNISKLTEDATIENIRYFTGNYEWLEHNYVKYIFSNPNVTERYSGILTNNSLSDILQNNTFDSDTYFLIGAGPTGMVEASYEQRLEFTRDTLGKCGFVELDNHSMIYNPEYDDELNNCSTRDEEISVAQKYLKEKLPSLNINGYNLEYLADTRYYAVGYINASGLKHLSQIIETDAESYGITLTWFPAPDDQERWLTIDPKYRE